MDERTEDYTVGDWIDAMQSRRYKMIQGRLGTPGTGNHCALGVLIEEAGNRAVDNLRGAGINPNLIMRVNDGSSAFKNRKYRAVIKYIKKETAACRDTVIVKGVKDA